MNNVQLSAYVASIVFASIGITLLSVLAYSTANHNGLVLILLGCFAAWFSCWAAASSDVTHWLAFASLVMLVFAVLLFLAAFVAVMA